MKPYVLLTVLLFSGLGVSVAQQRTRDKLFPTFQQDLSALQQKESKLAAPQARSSRSTKEQLFTDYRPQTIRQGNAGTLNAARASRGQNPSDISAEEAVKTAKARQTSLPAPEMSTPTQGNGSERSNGPIKTAVPNAAAPAKTGTSATPVKNSFERKKQ